LSSVRQGTDENPNADKDTNAQTIAELQHMIEYGKEADKAGYTAMLTDFIKSITPVPVESEAPAELGVNDNTESLIEETIVEEAPQEALEQISNKRTEAAIKATGITEGSWQIKNGPFRTGQNKNSAKYKQVDGVYYEWKAKDSGAVTLGAIASDAYQSFAENFSSMDSLIDNLNPYK
jgi:hypothetical protein